MKRLLLPILLAGLVLPLRAQHPERVSIHEMQSKNPPTSMPAGAAPRAAGKRAGARAAVVFGYHPYWNGASATDEYQFDLLSDVVYFSCEVDPATGGVATMHDWLSTPLVEKAHAAGTRIQLCATNFGSAANSALLGNPAARDTLIATLIRLVRQRNADGVNIDFEGVRGSDRGALLDFFRTLNTRFKSSLPRAVISAAVPAVDWNGAWDAGALAAVVDQFFLMGYDYSWSGSGAAGPVAPLAGMNYTVARSVEWYLAQGVPPGRLILGVPYYGYDWPVVSESPLASTTGNGTARTYSRAWDLALQYGRRWEPLFPAPWSAYRDAVSWRQCWYDDSASLAVKYDFALAEGLGGVGIWALGYDQGREELWDLLREKFSRSTPVEESGSARADFSLLIYPIPLRDISMAEIRLLPADALDCRLAAYDRMGRLAADFTGRLRGLPGDRRNILRLERRDFPADGIYFLQLRTPKGSLLRALPVFSGR